MLKWILEKESAGVNWIILTQQVLVAGSCEHGNES
jgi:hypothetical protein